MTKLLLILILIIGLSCIGFLWFTKRRRRDLRKATANGERAVDGRVSGKICRAQAEPAGATCNENAPDADLWLTESQMVVGDKEEPIGLSDEVDVSEESREIVRSYPVQTEPPAQALSATSAREVSEPVEFAQPTSPEESHPATDRPSPIGLGQTSFAPKKETVASSPVTEKPTGITATAEEREVKEVRSSQAEAPTELPEDTIEKGNGNARPSFAQAIADEVQQPVQPELEKTEAIPDTRLQKPPIYEPPVPVPPVVSSRTPRQPSPQSSGTRDSELHLRVQLVPDRRGGVRSFSLVPELRPNMPANLEVTGTQGEFALTQLDEFYEGVSVPDIEAALREGVEWRGKGSTHRRWRWVLSGRPLYVLAPGAEAGLNGFISVPRLLLGQKHRVLAVSTLRAEVLAALAETGCPAPEVMDETFPNVPTGWLVFSGVMPTRAVPVRDERHILNALCPLADVAPHFVGGIRLEARTWLLSYPPCIRFTGQLDEKFRVVIDGQQAVLSEIDGYIAPGWDSEGAHHLWFADQSVTYELRRCSEDWAAWSAYDFCTGAAVCGACVHPVEQTWHRQVRVPSKNPVLVGAEPGQIFRYHPRSDLRADTWLAMVPFEPVWALPADPAHVDKQSVHVVLVGGFEPVRSTTLTNANRASNRAVAAWCAAINDARRKGLAVATDDANVIALWRSYRWEARRLWRAMG